MNALFFGIGIKTATQNRTHLLGFDLSHDLKGSEKQMHQQRKPIAKRNMRSEDKKSMQMSFSLPSLTNCWPALSVLVCLMLACSASKASLTYCYDENNRKIAAPGQTIGDVLELEAGPAKGKIKVHAMCSGAPANHEVRVSIEQICPGQRKNRVLQELSVCVFKKAEIDSKSGSIVLSSFGFDSIKVLCSAPASETIAVPDCKSP